METDRKQVIPNFIFTIEVIDYLFYHPKFKSLSLSLYIYIYIYMDTDRNTQLFTNAQLTPE